MQLQGRGRGRAASNATSHRHRAPGAGPQREPGPPVRPRAARCSRRGATSTAGSSPTPASCSPGSTPRPTCSLAEALRDGLLDGVDRRPSSRRWCRASPTSAAGPTAERPDAAARAGRPRRSRKRARAIERICAGPAAPTRTTPGCPRPARPTPASRRRARLGGGDALADVLDDDEMTGGDFVRNVKQVHRPPAPDRRRRARRRDRATAPARPPTRASAASSRRRASSGASRRGPSVIEKGEPWGRPADGPGRRRRSTGDDAALAAAVARRTPARWSRFRPDADAPTWPAPSASTRRRGADAGRAALELPIDALRVTADGRDLFAVNMVVRRAPRPTGCGWFEPAPRRCGSSVDGRRGPRRPGDDRGGRQRAVPARPRPRAPGPPRRRPGRGPGVRAAARASGGRCAARLPQGAHLPHPDITQTTGRQRRGRRPTAARSPLEVDGVARAGRAARVTVDVVPGAFLLVRLSGSAETAKSAGGRRSRRYHRQPRPVAERAGGQTVGVYPSEHFTDDEAAVLRPYFTNLDRPVFALVNLPEVVKGALFARYSRSRQEPAPPLPRRVRRRPRPHRRPHRRRDRRPASAPKQLYDRVFLEYGDDSVAQLGGVHLACEQASNLLTKVLEWGRLMAYLEQSTRYIAYDSRLGGRYRYYRPPEVLESPLGARYIADIDALFDTYTEHAARDARLGARALPEGARRLRLRLQADDQGEGVRRGARHPARGDAVERRHLRHRPGLRGAAAAHARAPAARGPPATPR